MDIHLKLVGYSTTNRYYCRSSVSATPRRSSPKATRFPGSPPSSPMACQTKARIQCTRPDGPRGRSETEVNISTDFGKMAYRTRAGLLREVVGNFAGQPNTVFPFSFTFPATTLPVDQRHTDASKRTQQVDSVPATHALPPTYREDKGVDGKDHSCCIEYKIRATVWPILGPNGVAKPLFLQEKMLSFQPRADTCASIIKNGTL